MVAPISAPARCVYLALTLYADSKGECWPRQSALARLSGLSERQVRRMLTDLAALGMVEIERGSHRANRYRLPVDNSVLARIYEDIAMSAHEDIAMSSPCGHFPRESAGQRTPRSTNEVTKKARRSVGNGALAPDTHLPDETIAAGHEGVSAGRDALRAGRAKSRSAR